MERKGKLIIIEAGDGSGKATQTKALYDHLCREGYRVHRIEFPDYAADSSMLVRMYLRGDFGGHAEDVNAYAASTFFAVDRYASYRMKWKKAYEAGAIILADRYTTSNMVHQAVKLTDKAEREAFLDWLWDFEFHKLGLPVPDKVVFLDMDPEVADRLIAARAEETPMTIRSGTIVSEIADPSRRNSGFDATSKSTFLRLYRLIVSATFSPVRTGTVLLSTMSR